MGMNRLMNLCARRSAICGWIAALLMIATLGPAASAQDAGIEAAAAIEPNPMYLGDVATYTIAIEGSTQATTPPVVEGVDGAAVDYVSSGTTTQSSTRLVGGRYVRETVTTTYFRYAVRPVRAGVIDIPPQAVELGGVSARTNPTTLRVIEPETADGNDLVLTLSRREAFAGEPIDFSLAWYADAAQSIRRFDFSTSQLPDGVEADLPSTQGARRTQDTFGVVLFGQETIVRVTQTSRQGSRVNAVVLESGTLIVDEPGEYTFDRVAVTFDVTRSGRTVRQISRAEPVTLTVKPLPGDPPAGFGGLIGAFDIRAEASPTEVNVGDPIELRVTIRGREPMQGVRTGPDLMAIDGFAESFRLATDGWTYDGGRSRPGQRVFTTTIRAASDSVEAIPPITLPYFDTAEGSYLVAATDPIPLDVRAVKQVTAADAVTGATAQPTGTASVAREGLTPTAPGLWAVASPEAVLAADRFDVDRALREPGWIALLAGPPVVFGAVALGVTVARRRDPVATRRSNALRRALRALSRGGVDAAIRRYLADVFDRPPSAVTLADCERLVGGRFEESRTLAALLDRAERARFGGADASLDSPEERQRVRDLLRRLDAALRRSRR